MTRESNEQLGFPFEALMRDGAGASGALTTEESADAEALTTEAIEERDDADALRAQASALMTAASGLPSARRKLDLMLDTPNLELVAPLLPAEQLFFIMQEVGLSDALELLHVCSPEQFRCFVDLDAWDGDTFVPAKAVAWLRAAGTDTREDRFSLKLDALDIEVTERLLQADLRIWDLEETEDPEPEGEAFRSPEGKYVIEYRCEGVELLGMKRLVESLYARDAFQAARLMEAVRWELPSELEESAYRWRNARLADLGFPDMEEALSYFAYVDPKAALPAMRPPRLLEPVFALSRDVLQNRFLERALAEVTAEKHETVEGQLVALLNAVLVVDKVAPGDVDAVEAALERARDTLSLGLEQAASGDIHAGARILETSSLKRIFQVGVSLALKLRFRLDRLARNRRLFLPGSSEALWDEPWASIFRAVRRRRPRFVDCRDLAEVPLDSPALPERAFRTPADLAAAEREIACMEQLTDLMDTLGFSVDSMSRVLREAGLESEAPFLRFSTLYLTAVAREAAGLGFAFEPFPLTSLSELMAEVFEKRPDGTPVLRPGFTELLEGRLRRRAVDFSPAHVASAARFSALILERLRDELAEPWALGTLGELRAFPMLTVAG